MEPLGRVLGASWGILRPLGEVLEPLGALLGPLGVVCWGYVAAANFFDDFWFDFGPILGSKRLPKWLQNGSQNGPKSKAKINMKNYRFWNRLGRVLGPSWVVLGSILGSKIIKFHSPHPKCGVLIFWSAQSTSPLLILTSWNSIVS